MRERINKFAHSHIVLSAFLLAVLFILVLTAIGLVAMEFAEPIHGLALFTVGQLILALIAIWLMRKLHVFDRADFKFKNMGKGFLLGWFFLVAAGVNFVLNLIGLPESSFITPNPLTLIVVLLHPFIGTGLFEEVLVRGLILKLLLVTMGHTKRGVINAVVISSVIFGVAHIVNLIQADVLPVTSQIIYATATGILFAALYLRTKTLWVPILLHGLVNLSSQIFNAFIDFDMLPQNNEAQADIISLIINTLLIVIPCVITGFVLLRKVKPNEFADSGLCSCRV
jgi:membrane protease YdiL (CAAX protease family)